MPFLFIMGWIFLEFWVFFQLCATIGIGYTMLLWLAGAAIGCTILWRQGIGAVMAAQRGMVGGHSNVSAGGLFEGISTALAGILLVLPGFLSDIVALMLLIPRLRHVLSSLFGRRIEAEPFNASYDRPFDAEDAGHSHPFQPTGQDIIEGDYERLDKNE